LVQDIEANRRNAIEFYRTAYLGDLVALHTHQTWPCGGEYVTMGFFRFDENGRIVRHRDAIRPVPAETNNDNPMY
jgi:predicted SnoaL-like aldol condensation-catalyzing enzyme